MNIRDVLQKLSQLQDKLNNLINHYEINDSNQEGISFSAFNKFYFYSYMDFNKENDNRSVSFLLGKDNASIEDLKYAYTIAVKKDGKYYDVFTGMQIIDVKDMLNMIEDKSFVDAKFTAKKCLIAAYILKADKKRVAETIYDVTNNDLVQEYCDRLMKIKKSNDTYWENKISFSIECYKKDKYISKNSNKIINRYAKSLKKQ